MEEKGGEELRERRRSGSIAYAWEVEAERIGNGLFTPYSLHDLFETVDNTTLSPISIPLSH